MKKAKAKALVPSQPKPAKREKKLNPDEKRAVGFLKGELKITEKEAKAMLFEEGGLDDYFRYRKKEIDFGIVDLLAQLQSAIKEKVKKGSARQAQGAVTSFAILYEKLYGRTPVAGAIDKFQIAGKNIKINLGWDFKPYERSK